MSDTAAAPSEPLSPRDEAHVAYGLRARALGDLAYGLLAHDPDAPPGDRVRRALALRERLDALIAQAGVADKEDGATWSEIGTAAGITRQSAQGRWSPHVTAWAATGRRALRDHHGLTALGAAAGLDAAHARAADDDDQQHVFSRALDAVRFPGAEAAERARRERAVTVRARLAVLADTDGRHQDELHRLARTGAAPADRAAALHHLAALREETAERHAELARLEPDTADTHHTAAAQARDRAAHDREFAALLTSQDTPTPTP
ncbi:hypothetical protein [Streptomyces ortus]|uniref:Uncharacterized protein n=1 Tax=Streptomyces ortus TaxID=2867268 RepID=A0ABT3UW48_9ACTN|nr:hypothetical protein [Streptomyces ortus]MCX4231797.1 hypothetical protein [Streptomyces ortus]